MVVVGCRTNRYRPDVKEGPGTFSSFGRQVVHKSTLRSNGGGGGGGGRSGRRGRSAQAVLQRGGRTSPSCVLVGYCCWNECCVAAASIVWRCWKEVLRALLLLIFRRCCFCVWPQQKSSYSCEALLRLCVFVCVCLQWLLISSRLRLILMIDGIVVLCRFSMQARWKPEKVVIDDTYQPPLYSSVGAQLEGGMPTAGTIVFASGRADTYVTDSHDRQTDRQSVAPRTRLSAHTLRPTVIHPYASRLARCVLCFPRAGSRRGTNLPRLKIRP